LHFSLQQLDELELSHLEQDEHDELDGHDDELDGHDDELDGHDEELDGHDEELEDGHDEEELDDGHDEEEELDDEYLEKLIELHLLQLSFDCSLHPHLTEPHGF